jgi:hypothetical protein
MRRESIAQLAAVGVMVGALVASSVFAVQLTASGGRYRLGYADTATEGQPPNVSLGIAMGAFRGIFVNFLWIRAHQLKEDGRYYEALDLSKAITTLQPRFPQVWAFHAWNMAYNISVNSQTPAERWRWVNAGIHLLRSQGVIHNPNDLLIHRELGWIFLHKVGGYMDDANPFYKRQLAGEWSLVLGPPPAVGPSYRDRERAKQTFVDWLQPVASAPDTPDQLYARSPKARELVDRIRTELRFDPDWQLNQNYVVLEAISGSGTRPLFEQHFTERQRAMLALMRDPQYEQAWKDVLSYIRKRMLVDDYRMEPERMIRLTQQYGPLDWRHWGAHGLYWSTRGIENAMTRVSASNVKDFDFLNANRVAVQSLQDLWRTGDVYFDLLGFIRDPEDDGIFMRHMPNVHFIEAYGDNLEFFMRTAFSQGRNFEGRDRAYGLMASGYENFRKDAVRFLYRRGEVEIAERMKEELAVWPHHNTNDPERKDIFKLDIHDFVTRELENELTRPSVAREEIVGALQGAYASLLTGVDAAYFYSQLNYAAMVHQYFFTKQGRRTLVARERARMEQFDSDFRILAGTEFAAMLFTLDLDQAERVFDAAPEDLKRYGYDLIVERFKTVIDEAAARGGRTFAQVFPEPRGMAEHRRDMERMLRERQQSRPNVERQ